MHCLQGESKASYYAKSASFYAKMGLLISMKRSEIGILVENLTEKWVILG